MRAIAVAKNHGLHEPVVVDRSTDDVIAAAKQAEIAWLPSDVSLNAMDGRKFTGLRAALRADLDALELSKSKSWLDIDASTGAEHSRRLRVRAIQAEKEARRLRRTVDKLSAQQGIDLIPTYEEEREAFLGEIQKLNDELLTLRTELPQIDLGQSPLSEVTSYSAPPLSLEHLEEKMEATRRLIAEAHTEVHSVRVTGDDSSEMIAQLQDSLKSTANVLGNGLEELFDISRSIQAAQRGPSVLEEHMGNEINFLREVVEKLMSK